MHVMPCLSKDVEWHGKKPQGLMDHFWQNCRKMTKEATACFSNSWYFCLREKIQYWFSRRNCNTGTLSTMKSFQVSKTPNVVYWSFILSLIKGRFSKNVKSVLVVTAKVWISRQNQIAIFREMVGARLKVSKWQIVST